MSAEARWSYYTASYIKVEPTEGVPLDQRFNMPFLKRNIARDLEDAEDHPRAEPAAYEDALELRICVNSYKILWEPQTSEFFVQGPSVMFGDGHDTAELERAKKRRRARFVEKAVESNTWTKDLSEGEAERTKARFVELARDEQAKADAVAAEVAAAAEEAADRMNTDA
jgi:paired amphipathic helix protein Sin3a